MEAATPADQCLHLRMMFLSRTFSSLCCAESVRNLQKGALSLFEILGKVSRGKAPQKDVGSKDGMGGFARVLWSKARVLEDKLGNICDNDWYFL